MPQRTHEELRDYADEHLLYEIEMVAALTARMARQGAMFDDGLSEADDLLASEVLELAGRNADIEAWVTHLANVFNFLYCNRKHADVVAYDFFDRHHDWTERLPRVPKSLERINARMPVEIDHLSFRRTEVEDKTWMYERMWSDLAGVLRLFLDTVPRECLSETFHNIAGALLPADPIESIDKLARKMRVGVTLADSKVHVDGYELRGRNGNRNAAIRQRGRRRVIGNDASATRKLTGRTSGASRRRGTGRTVRRARARAATG